MEAVPDRCANCRRSHRYYGSTGGFCNFVLWCWPCTHVFLSAVLISVRLFPSAVRQAVMDMLLPRRYCIWFCRGCIQAKIWSDVFLKARWLRKDSTGEILDFPDAPHVLARQSGSFRHQNLHHLRLLWLNDLQPACLGLVNEDFCGRHKPFLLVVLHFLGDYNSYRVPIVGRICWQLTH